MRLRIHHPLFGGFLGVTGLLVVLTVAMVGRGLRRELVETYRGELEHEMGLAAWIVEASYDQPLDSVVRRLQTSIGYRVTLIDTAGTVLADSDVPRSEIPNVESHATRPEVIGALGGQLTFSQRTSATVGAPLLYAARMARFGDRPVVLRIAAPLNTVGATVSRVQRAVAFTGLLAMALSLLVAYWLSVVLARPLVVLAERARQLAQGDFSTRLPRRGSGVAELSDLTLAFNRLNDELQARMTELRRDRDEMGALIDTMAEGVVALTDDARLLRANKTAYQQLGLPRDLPAYAPVGTLVRQQDLRDLLEESVVHPLQSREIQVGDRVLLAASRRLDLGGAVTTFLDITERRRLEQVRRDFVANASHELKTPLTAVRGFAETLLESEPPEDLRVRFLSSIRDNTLRMQRLVDDLLDLSRLESGGWTAGQEDVSVAELARETWAQFAERAREREIEFAVVGDAEVEADPQGLEQIFRNLMENSLRHSEDGGSIELEVTRPTPHLVEIAFSDDGEGIPSRALPRIFERFYRADSSRARDIGGTGLGLAIVRHLVNAMGGDVWAESELGKGTTIRFTLRVRED